MMLQIKFGCNRPAGLGDIHVWKCGRTHGRTDGRTDARTDARTPARVPSYKLTLWAFGSGELKKNVNKVILNTISQLRRYNPATRTFVKTRQWSYWLCLSCFLWCIVNTYILFYLTFLHFFPYKFYWLKKFFVFEWLENSLSKKKIQLTFCLLRWEKYKVTSK